MIPPETHYVTVNGAQVAYQLAGNGSKDVTICLPLGGQIDGFWQLPPGPELLSGLGDVRRLIVFDRRGSGASDPLPPSGISRWEGLAEDLLAVLDKAGSERTALIGVNDTGPIAILFAATHPERVSHLIFWTTTARWMAADDYPFGASSQAIDAFVNFIATSWGTEDFARLAAPTRDPEEIAAWMRMLRSSATPRSAATQWDYITRNVDVRRFLPLVQAPTLIFHPTDSVLLPIEHGRYLADHLPRATLIEWETTGFQPPDPAKTTSDMIEFLTGERPTEVDRVLATVLFTDIVGSTERAASLGDHSWHRLLDAHDRAVREQMRRFGGKEVKTTGDGFLVSFDGPARAIRCALAVNEAMESLGIDLRMGLHTGECEVRGDDLGGLAVHIAARIAALGTSQQILVSSTLKDLVIGSGLAFTERGDYDLKGVPGTWKIFAVAP
jgi:class 3 adenylate cyclase